MRPKRITEGQIPEGERVGGRSATKEESNSKVVTAELLYIRRLNSDSDFETSEDAKALGPRLY